jgi:hypothetical protein
VDSIEDRILAAQDEISRLKRRRAPFRRIEAYVDGLDFSEDQKAALWMYAWALQPRRVLRAETTALLQLVR